MTSEYLSLPKGRSKSLLLFFSGTGPPYHAEKSEIKQGDSPHKNDNPHRTVPAKIVTILMRSYGENTAVYSRGYSHKRLILCGCRGNIHHTKEADTMPRIIKTVQLQPKPEMLLNVAVYARVSSGKDARSLSAQVSFYSSMIQNHKGWNYAGVYSDEAITGTKETRESFQRLLNDCRDGKIDLVITKSISRFARNTVTLLKTVRELKNLGVDVHFEEQNIHTISAEGELMLTVLASYAQEESLSVSENCKWKIRKILKTELQIHFRSTDMKRLTVKL